MIGHVYRIIHLESDVQYVGSTFNEPRKRWQHHKHSYNDWLKNNHSKIAIYPYFQEPGLDKFKLIPIKSYDVVDRRHLEAYEQLWMSKLKCLNAKNVIQIRSLYHKSRGVCDCGSGYLEKHKTRHLRTKKHQDWFKSQ
jgi:uncharacterized UPF0160 family protein